MSIDCSRGDAADRTALEVIDLDGIDEDGKSYVSNDGITAKTTTDDFGRTTKVKTSRGEGKTVFFSNYEYANGSAENSTTTLVSKLTQKYGTKAYIVLKLMVQIKQSWLLDLSTI